jgi:DNA polymerase type B, organellar and viral
MKFIHDNKQLVFWIDNPGLLSHKEVVKSIFKVLKSNKDFKGFGRKKVVIIQGLIDGQERSFHQNVIMNNQTTFKKYWSVVKDLIITNYEDGYPLNTINQFKVRVWSMNNVKNKNIKLTQNAIYYRPKTKTTVNKRNYSTSTVKQHIIPLKNPKSLKPQLFMCMDIETMNINGNQIPVLITTHSLNNSKNFMIDKDLLNSNPDLALSKLWDLFYDFLNKQSIKFIFVHNLGKFDGIFIFKYLLNQYKKESIKPIIDQHNTFVSITIKLDNINIKFPVSLNELCKIFKVEGKTNSYNSEYNNTSLFNNKTLFSEWLNYSKQDSAALFNALVNAQLIYLEKYKIDLTSIVSISSLSFKIFRQDFLNLSIPILNKIQDHFIRKSYIGGATDYYRKFLKKGYHYDVNSLYPFAMLKPMPHKLIKFHKDLSNHSLVNLFGFFKAEIITPKNLIYPLLPYRIDGLTLHPTGKFTGVYFSEELKAVEAQGYKLKLLEGYEFSKTNLFNSYIETFFEQKRTSKGTERFIAKLHLNTLYGYFGRSLDLLETVIVKNDKLNEFSLNKKIKNLYEINSEYSSVLTNKEFNENSFIKSNVAIASAVTSYARIEMIKIKVYCLKNNIKIYYTDTDSIFTDKPLPNKMIGEAIGLLKDEMNGNLIQEAYFLGIKQYGFTI